jgi:release factor glutamine methyltransferase
VAADEEAAELVARAGDDPALLASLAERRVNGEPLAWITGLARFGDLTLRVDPGVYVPRWQSLTLARRAEARLPADGCAVDLCTGTGAIAATLLARRPRARVVATDVDPRAVACARANGVDASLGDLDAAVPRSLEGTVDVVVAVVPYVPTPALDLLPRDTLRFEDAAHYDGGPDGAVLLRRTIAAAARLLHPGAALLLELGGEQADLLGPVLRRHGFADPVTWDDDEGDVRGLETTLRGAHRS